MLFTYSKVKLYLQCKQVISVDLWFVFLIVLTTDRQADQSHSFYFKKRAMESFFPAVDVHQSCDFYGKSQKTLDKVLWLVIKQVIVTGSFLKYVLHTMVLWLLERKPVS